MPLPERRWSNLSFGVLFLGVLALFLWVVAPFLVSVLVAAFLVVIAYPLQRRLTSALHGRERLAALASTFLTFLVVVIPALAVGYAFVVQGIELTGKLQGILGPGALEGLLQGRVPARLQPLVEKLQLEGAIARIQQGLNALAAGMARFVTTLVGVAARFAIDLFLWLVATYYFFAGGERIVRGVMESVPMERRYMEEFFAEFRQVAQTMIVVHMVTALAQGALGAVGFVIAGVPSPVVWGALIAFFALIPAVGSALIWLPAGVILLIAGHVVAGIFLLAWGTLVVGTVDNILRPFLAKGRISLHPLLIFVTIFGGIVTMGIVGIVMGPLIGAIFTAMIRIWKRDFIPRLGGPTTAPPEGQAR